MSTDPTSASGGLTFPDLNLDAVMTTAPEGTKRPLLEHLEGDDWVLKIDNSTMSQFQTCPRSAYFYCVERRQRPDRSPLIFGGAIHEGLELYYKGKTLAECVTAILDYFERHPVVQPDEWRTPAYAAENFLAYVKHWEVMDNIKPISNEWVEKPFSLNVGSFGIDGTLPFTYAMLSDHEVHEPMYITTLHVQWSGKIDIGAIDHEDVISVVDHKTSSMGGPTFFDDFILAQQTHGYTWAMQQLIGRPVNRFILNALLIRKPTKTGTPREFDRKTYTYPQAEIEEWRSDMLMSIENFIHSLTNNAFPKYTSWCMGKYGKCQYHDVCVLPSSQRKLMLGTDLYANVIWSPLNQD